jgi:hypothetical protein
MAFVLRQILSKSVFLNFERELSGSIATQVATVPAMVDNMLAAQAYAYQPQHVLSVGAYQTTGRRSSPVVQSQLLSEAPTLHKVYVPLQNKGLFVE